MSTLSTTNIKHPSSASNNIVLDSSGRVGVGTTSPDNKLHVFAGDSSGSSHASAQLTIENSGNSALQFLAGTSGSSEIRFGDSGDNGAGSIAYVHSDNSLRFGTNNGTEKARIDSSGNLQFNSGYGSVATAYGCRAWVSFNGTGSTSSNQTVRGSGNVSSVYKNSQGNYTINFATAMPDANYAISGICTEAGYGAEGVRLASTDPTASACVIDTSRYTAQIDVDWVTVMFIR